MAPAGPTQYWLLPFRGAPLLLTIVTCLLLRLAASAGLLGLPLMVVLVSWVWSYAYLLVDCTAHGLPPPVLSIEMINPLHERGPALQALLAIAAAGFIWWLDSNGWHLAALATAASVLALAPASLAVLAVEGNLLRAVWPPALVAVTREIGLRYLLLIAATGLATTLVIATRSVVAPLLWNAIAVSAVFTIASLLGGALYERRAALGLEAWQSPERQAERQSRLTERERDREVDQIYGLVRAREHAEAFARVSALLGAPPVDPARCRWLRDRAAQWEDPRIAERLTGELVARLLALGQRGEAILVVEDWWRRGRRFVALTARDLDLLERAAIELGHVESARRLRIDCGPVASNPAAPGR